MAGSRQTLIFLLLTNLAAAAQAAELNARLELEDRYFYQADEQRNAPSVAASADFFLPLRGDGKTRISGELFARRDRNDSARTHSDVRELYYQAIGDDFEFRAGARRVFWGVTESRHLVDIINQSDFVEDFDNKSKLGQPMMNLALIRGWGTLDLFVMPYQRQRTYPGPEGHPRLPFPVAADEAMYESPRKQHHLDYAARWRQSFDELDLGIAYFDGTAREPRILPCLRRGSGFRGTENGPNCDIFSGIIPPQSPLPAQFTPLLQALGLAPSDEQVRAQITRQVLANIVLVPRYDRLRQWSLDAQYVIDALALKLETVARTQGGGHSLAAVAGFEYSFGDVGGLGWDVAALGEYLYDQRTELLNSRYDHDWFAGTRIGFNDVAGTQILAGAIVDKSGHDQVYSIEASRRLNDQWRALLKFRSFEDVPGGSVTGFLAKEDVLSLTLQRFY